MTRRNPTERELRLRVRHVVLRELSTHHIGGSMDKCLEWIYRDYPGLLLYARELVKALETGNPIDNEAARSV